MRKIIAKVDYMLYEEMFFYKDLDAVVSLWEKVINNQVFLNSALEIVTTKTSGKHFLSPMICLMILKYPELVPESIYDKLVRLVLQNPDVTSSIAIDESRKIDYLSLILKNPEVKLSDFETANIIKRVIQEYGIIENKKVAYYTILEDIVSPTIATYKSDTLEVKVSEYEFGAIESKNLLSLRDIQGFKSISDYRSAILTNSNFTEAQKRDVLNQMINDEVEFESMITSLLHELEVKYRIPESIHLSIDTLNSLTEEEIKDKVKDGDELIKELKMIKGLLIFRYFDKFTLSRDKK